MVTKNNPIRLYILAAMFILISFMLGCNEFMVVGNLSLIAKTYHQTLSQSASIISVFAWTYAIATPLLALSTNRFNKRPLFLTLMVFFLAGTTLSALAPTLNLFLFSRVMTAAVAGLLESLMSVIAFQMGTTTKQRSMLVAWVYTGFSVASVIGVPLGTFIATIWRWQDAFVMVAVITMLATSVAFFLIPRRLAGQKASFRDQLILFSDRRIWLAICFSVCSAGMIFGYYTYIRSLIHQTLGFSLTALSTILLLLGVLDVLSNQYSGHLAEQNGLKRLRPFYVVDLILLALFQSSMANSWCGLLMLCLLVFLFPLFSSPIQIFVLNIASQDFPQATTMASTLTAVFYNVGVALSSFTAAKTIIFADLTALGWNSLLYCFMGLLALLAIVRLTNGEKD